MPGLLGRERGSWHNKKSFFGRLAQLVRAPRLHRGGPRFEPVIAHHPPPDTQGGTLHPIIRDADTESTLDATCSRI